MIPPSDCTHAALERTIKQMHALKTIDKRSFEGAGH